MNAEATPSAPVPGESLAPLRSTGIGFGSASAPANAKSKTSATELPLSIDDAKARLAELKALLLVSHAAQLHDPIYHLCEWLADSADAHYKMAAAFSHHDALKPQAAAEKQAAMRFSSLKNQAQLLKADLLISQKRYPEALAPLVDIVLNEPTSTTGQSAYDRLIELGFSEEPTLSEQNPAAPASLAANTALRPAPKQPTARPTTGAKPPTPVRPRTH